VHIQFNLVMKICINFIIFSLRMATLKKKEKNTKL
ncbi:unnamed protein product, partial [Onchocerca ochengi]